MIAKEYLSLQASTLLKLARITSDPKTAASLINKAAELQARSDESGKNPGDSPKPPQERRIHPGQQRQ